MRREKPTVAASGSRPVRRFSLRARASARKSAASVDNFDRADETSRRRLGQGGKKPAMITGCNTNVLYRGKQFHVQTEDSGRGKPHIISHVYHGGTIIASEKSSYAHRIDAEELDIKVRAQIELQHKTMLKRLTGGEFDGVIDDRLGGGAAAAKPSPPPIGAAAAAESSASGGSTSGSITAGADTHPSIGVERPAAETKPMFEKPATRAFGDGIDSEKPLDEVILEYLVDKARDRAAEKKQPTARKQRQKG